MKYLSNTALKYMVNTCAECPNYKAIVVCESLDTWLNATNQVFNYTSPMLNIHTVLKNNSGDCRIKFANDSIIEIVLAYASVTRRYRVNLILVDSNVDKEYIHIMLRPMEAVYRKW